MAKLRRHRHEFPDAVAQMRGLLLTAASADRRLPPVRALCRDFGFSASTVQRALRALESEGLCRVLPRGGVVSLLASVPTVAGIPTSTPSLPASRRTWEHVRESLSQDLLAGTRGHDNRLASAKELAARFGVSHRTLQRALQSLCTQGYLRRIGRGYRVSPLGTGTAGSAVAFIGHGETLADMFEFTPRAVEQLHTIERQCAENHVRLEFISFRDAVFWRGNAPRLLSPVSTTPVLGTLLWTTALYPQDIEPIATHLLDSKLPTALLDENGTLAIPPRLLASPLVAAYTIAVSEQAGREVGRYLALNGHRHVAYVSLGDPSAAQSSRARGLAAGLRGLRADAQVSAVALQHATATGAARAEPVLGELLRHMEEAGWGTSGNPHRMRVLFDAQVLRDMDLVRAGLTAQVRALLNIPSLTALVAYNDIVGFTLLEILRELRVDVPGRVSVVGFDDEPGAFTAGLTSYNFNAGAVAQRMFEHVLSPQVHRARGTQGWIEVPGFVVERSSSGHASA